MYEYEARVLKVVDGDTVHLEVDLGFDVRRKDSFRLAGLNAPELWNEGGREAWQWLYTVLVTDMGGQARITTEKDRREKFGRYLATLWKGDVNLNQAMIDQGLAVPYVLP